MKYTKEKIIELFKQEKILVVEARELLLGVDISFKNSNPAHKAKYESIRDAVKQHKVHMILDGLGFTNKSSLETLSFFKWAIHKYPNFKAQLPRKIFIDATEEFGKPSLSFKQDVYHIPIPDNYEELEFLYRKLFDENQILKKEVDRLKPLEEKEKKRKEQGRKSGKKSAEGRREQEKTKIK